MSSFLHWCRRYITISAIAVVVAIVYMMFFHDNSMAQIYANDKTIDSLNRAIADNEDSMNYYRRLNVALDNYDPAVIERVVRENHNMNRENEDVYIFE